MSGAPNIRGITIDTAADIPKVLDQWGLEEVSERMAYVVTHEKKQFFNHATHFFQGLVAPHSLAISQTGDAVYVADMTTGKDKIKKFEVVRSGDFI